MADDPADESGPVPLFVERHTYRRRRLMDAIRALPVLGVVLWMLPMLWALPGAGMRGAAALIYLFAVWIGLIALAGGLLLALRLWERRAGLDHGERGR